MTRVQLRNTILSKYIAKYQNIVRYSITINHHPNIVAKKKRTTISSSRYRAILYSTLLYSTIFFLRYDTTVPNTDHLNTHTHTGIVVSTKVRNRLRAVSALSSVLPLLLPRDSNRCSRTSSGQCRNRTRRTSAMSAIIASHPLGGGTGQSRRKEKRIVCTGRQSVAVNETWVRYYLPRKADYFFINNDF